MKKRKPNRKIVKHQHATPNPIIQREEEVMLSIVDKALESSSNSQAIGRNGEIPLRGFLNRYLPYTLRAVTGHFVPPSGRLSPQIDVMILDARYPLLAENADGSVLAMLHSVLKAIEVKTRITVRDIEKIWKDSIRIMELASEVEGYGDPESFSAVDTAAFAYRSALPLDSLEQKYVEVGDPQKSDLDITVLRLQARNIKKETGVDFHFEPAFASERSKKVIGYTFILRASLTPLSDLYFEIVQNSYYTLGTRGHSYGDIGRHVMDYMSWATAL